MVHAVERCLVLLLVVEVAGGSMERALVGGGLLGGAFALRGVLRARARRALRDELVPAAGRALVDGDVLRSDLAASAPIEVGVFEGLFYAETLVADTLPALAGDVVASAIVAAVVVGRTPPLFVAIAAGALVIGSVAVLVGRRVATRALDRAQRAYRPVVDGIAAAVAARLELAASGRAEDFLDDLRASTRHWSAVAARGDAFAALAGRAPVAAAALGAMLAAVLVRAAAGPIGLETFADAAILATVVPPFAGVARGALELARSGARLGPLAALLRSPLAPRGGRVAPPDLPAPIALRGVTFRYAGAPGDSLRDLSIDWMPGRVLALTGANGSGKSTVLRLLLGLARPAAGAVTVAGIDLFDLDLAAFRRKVAYLPQRPYLPERASVRDAVRLIARDADDAAIERALAEVDLLEALRAHSREPLDVRVGTLSMGQKQRLALARALVQRADVLLLDEPDANLDAAGIDLVARLVRELAPTRMIAVAAHTPALVAAGDLVVPLAPPDRV